MSAADTAENRAFIQKHRLWLLGEIITMRLITDKPEEPIAMIINVLNGEKSKQTEAIDPPAAGVAADAKDYLQKHRIAFIIEDWLRSVLEVKPENPLDFSCDYFAKMSGGASAKGGESAPPAAATTEEAKPEEKPAAESS